MTLRKKAFENIVGNGENAGTPAFSPFPACFSTLPDSNFSLWVTFILLSANALNLDRSGIWLLGKEVNFPYFDHVKRRN